MDDCQVCQRPTVYWVTVTFGAPTGPLPVRFCGNCYAELFQFMIDRWNQASDDIRPFIAELRPEAGLDAAGTLSEQLVTKVTFDLNDGDQTVIVEVDRGAVGGGWGVSRVEVNPAAPLRPEHLGQFLDAVAQMIVAGGVDELIALHDSEDAGVSDGGQESNLETDHSPHPTGRPWCPDDPSSEEPAEQ